MTNGGFLFFKHWVMWPGFLCGHWIDTGEAQPPGVLTALLGNSGFGLRPSLDLKILSWYELDSLGCGVYNSLLAVIWPVSWIRYSAKISPDQLPLYV